MGSAVATKEVQDGFEYEGHTVVAHVRKRGQRIVWREWILFDSVDEAFDFYSQQIAA